MKRKRNKLGRRYWRHRDLE